MHQWQAAPPESLDWASWGGEHVLYHRPSGKTHLLNAASVRLLTVILLAPRSLSEIETELAGGGIAQDGAEVLGMLLRLEELGLVEAR